MELPKDENGKVNLQFEWESESFYEDEDENLECELEDRYEEDTWEECCDVAADCYDWDDEDVVNFEAESELHETSRSLTRIVYLDINQEWTECPKEVYAYYEKAEAKAMGFDE